MTDQTSEFGDIDRREEQQKFDKRLREVIKKLAATVWHPVDKGTILEFLDVLQWSNGTDESVLPFYSRRAPYTHNKNKIECLLAAICCAVQGWWQYQQQILTSDNMEVYIVGLERIVEDGLDQYKVIGDLKIGYILHKGKK